MQKPKTFIYLREIEVKFWKFSDEFLGSNSMPINDLGYLMSLLDSYREVVDSFAQKRCAAKGELIIQIRSIEVLVVWVGYCVLFNSIKISHSSIIDGFGVALRFQDLKHLLLRDTTHILVLKSVASFLHDHYTSEKELFSTRESNENWNSPTFEMVRRYAESKYKSIYDQERDNANVRIEKHWNEVGRKQNLARKLRVEKNDLDCM